jgi:hypothetical protein
MGYHYNRRERLSMESAPPPRLDGSFFRRNRHLAIILLDLLVLVILFFALRIFVPGGHDRARLAGYQVTLRGFPYEEVVLASVSVKRISKKPAGDYESIQVRFALAEDGEAVEVDAFLPNRPGEETVLRRAVPAAGKAETLFAELILSGGESREERKDRLSSDLEW